MMQDLLRMSQILTLLSLRKGKLTARARSGKKGRAWDGTGKEWDGDAVALLVPPPPARRGGAPGASHQKRPVGVKRDGIGGGPVPLERPHRLPPVQVVYLHTATASSSGKKPVALGVCVCVQQCRLGVGYCCACACVGGCAVCAQPQGGVHYPHFRGSCVCTWPKASPVTSLFKPDRLSKLAAFPTCHRFTLQSLPPVAIVSPVLLPSATQFTFAAWAANSWIFAAIAPLRPSTNVLSVARELQVKFGCGFNLKLFFVRSSWVWTRSAAVEGVLLRVRDHPARPPLCPLFIGVLPIKCRFSCKIRRETIAKYAIPTVPLWEKGPFRLGCVCSIWENNKL